MTAAAHPCNMTCTDGQCFRADDVDLPDSELDVFQLHNYLWESPPCLPDCPESMVCVRFDAIPNTNPTCSTLFISRTSDLSSHLLSPSTTIYGGSPGAPSPLQCLPPVPRHTSCFPRCSRRNMLPKASRQVEPRHCLGAGCRGSQREGFQP